MASLRDRWAYKKPKVDTLTNNESHEDLNSQNIVPDNLIEEHTLESTEPTPESSLEPTPTIQYHEPSIDHLEPNIGTSILLYIQKHHSKDIEKSLLKKHSRRFTLFFKIDPITLLNHDPHLGNAILVDLNNKILDLFKEKIALFIKSMLNVSIFKHQINLSLIVEYLPDCLLLDGIKDIIHNLKNQNSIHLINGVITSVSLPTRKLSFQFFLCTLQSCRNQSHLYIEYRTHEIIINKCDNSHILISNSIRSCIQSSDFLCCNCGSQMNEESTSRSTCVSQTMLLTSHGDKTLYSSITLNLNESLVNSVMLGDSVSVVCRLSRNWNYNEVKNKNPLKYGVQCLVDCIYVDVMYINLETLFY